MKGLGKCGHSNGPGKWKTQIRTGCTHWKANEAKNQMRDSMPVHKETVNIPQRQVMVPLFTSGPECFF